MPQQTLSSETQQLLAHQIVHQSVFLEFLYLIRVSLFSSVLGTIFVKTSLITKFSFHQNLQEIEENKNFNFICLKSWLNFKI